MRPCRFILVTGAAAALLAVPLAPGDRSNVLWAALGGCLLALLVRALWRSWRGASRPHLLAGLLFGAAAAAFAGAAGWVGSLAAGSLTRAPTLAGLTVGLFAVSAGAIIALVSVPAVRALRRSRPVARLGRERPDR